MRLGIGSYTYVWSVGVPGYPAPARPLTPADILARAAGFGLRVVQIADNLPLDALGDGELDELRRRADDLRIEIEVGTAGIVPENLLRQVEIARRLRARVLRTVIDTAADRPTPEEAVARLAALVPAFEEAGVTLAIENHDRFPARVLGGIVDRLDSPRIGVCLDTANSLGCLEGVEHVVEIVGPRVVNLHIKDVWAFRPPHHKGFVIEGRPAGQGQLDIPALLRRVRQLGADPNVILELWPPPEAAVTDAVAKEERWTEESLAYLRTLISD